MKRFKLLIVLAFAFSVSIAQAADTQALKELFKENFNSHYQPRFCGRNINTFINEAKLKNIDLSNSYVLKIVGGGFLETSGFYTRQNTNERVMIGYFHMVLVADGLVFDFDLNEPLVLNTLEYVRLQFTPAYEPYFIFGINYSKKASPGGWNVTAFDYNDYGDNIETELWDMKMKEYIDIEAMYKSDRIR
jgi:hypothetical protein